MNTTLRRDADEIIHSSIQAVLPDKAVCRALENFQPGGGRALLVDDVITTGTTAAACAQALLHAGAESVFALAFATVEFGAPPDDTTPICEDDEEEAYSDF